MASRGFGVRDRTQPVVAQFENSKVLWIPRDPHTTIATSHWSTRGWTFQEATLSRRRLVFTDDQVYFQCKAMNCFESVDCWLERMHVQNMTKTYDTMRAGYFGKNREREFGKLNHPKNSLNETFCRYLSSVEDYTGRILRFDEDSFNAFEGITRHFSRQAHSLRHVWGLAYKRDDRTDKMLSSYSLSWVHIPLLVLGRLGRASQIRSSHWK